MLHSGPDFFDARKVCLSYNGHKYYFFILLHHVNRMECFCIHRTLGLLEDVQKAQ